MMSRPTTPVLVTGAAGFLGSAVTHELVARGYRVLALDRDFSDARLEDRPEIERVCGDVRDADLIDELVSRSCRVLHFAAIAGVHDYLERPMEVLDINLLGTRGVLKSAHAHQVPILIASTSEVFGKNPTLLDEGGDTWLGPTTNARWCYAASKIASEHYAWALAKQGLAVSAVRYFNVYGPYLDRPGAGRVISQFLGAVQEGRPLVLVDGGHAVRCFCYIDDAVRATVELALAVESGSDLVGRPFNVGNPEPVSMRELAAEVVSMTHHEPGTVDQPGPEFFGSGFEDIPHRVPDTAALEEAIGFRAETPLREGLRRTLDAWGLLRSPPWPHATSSIPAIRPVYDADAPLMAAIRSSLDRGQTTNHGPHTQELEARASEWLGARVLAVASGAAGLELAAQALVDAPGCAILPSFTYIATLNAVEHAGLRPVFCDVDPGTWTLDPAHLRELLSAHDDVRLIVPVNVFGIPPDLDAIADLAGDIPLLYDAAHALGTTVQGARHDPRPAATVFSLHATKLLPAIEGGLVACRSPAMARRLEAMRRHGLTPDPLDAVPGTNAKIDEISAAVALHGLRRVDGILSRRREYAARIEAAAVATGRFYPQVVPEGVVSNHQNLCLLCRDELETVGEVLDAHGVGWRRYFHPPLHRLRRLPECSLPATEALAAKLICLPLHSRMSEATLMRITEALEAAAR